ncbi:MAG TPA: hypothetical protein VGJ20_21345 [Xanthobacteraceae bacterium]|jgi:hypothetical protein
MSREALPPDQLLRTDMAEDIHQKMRTQYGLKEPEAHIASYIVEAQRHMLDLIEAQSPPVLEALRNYVKDIQYPAEGARPFRMKLEACLTEYVNDALKEQRKLERTLRHGVTGETGVVGEDDQG